MRRPSQDLLEKSKQILCINSCDDIVNISITSVLEENVL